MTPLPVVKPFPSIAAMALMGKAINNLHPCDASSVGGFCLFSRPRNVCNIFITHHKIFCRKEVKISEKHSDISRFG
ncbi:hypothetical protein V6N13_146672 [Hibiscus sabdariffa]|uniref:Uncharacterized protein n=1 Tax=Hibiscus sabdariffa TaxID=183260 RepID=A0ABR2TT89_9ROSI